MILSGMATLKGRERALKKALKSILPQVDRLHLTLNGYTSIPDFVKSRQIIVRLDPSNSKADNAKFDGLEEGCRGYYFTLDDDIIYPADYVVKMTQAIERHDRRAVVGVHGIIYKEPLKRYPQDRIVFGFSKPLERERQVHAVGTGTAAFAIPEVGYSVGDVPTQTRMIDVHFAGWCNNNGIKMYAVERPAGWLKALEADDSIWSQTQSNPTFRKSIFNAVRGYSPWPDVGEK